MKGLLDFLVNIASTPAILVALIAIIGLVLSGFWRCRDSPKFLESIWKNV